MPRFSRLRKTLPLFPSSARQGKGTSSWTSGASLGLLRNSESPAATTPLRSWLNNIAHCTLHCLSFSNIVSSNVDLCSVCFERTRRSGSLYLWAPSRPPAMSWLEALISLAFNTRCNLNCTLLFHLAET